MKDQHLSFKNGTDIICRPLELIFKIFYVFGVLPQKWKKDTSVPIHQKGDKQFLKSCRPVSLSQIREKL